MVCVRGLAGKGWMVKAYSPWELRRCYLPRCLWFGAKEKLNFDNLVIRDLRRRFLGRRAGNIGMSTRVQIPELSKGLGMNVFLPVVLGLCGSRDRRAT